MAAAAALYFIKDYQDTEAAKQILQQTTNAAKRMSTYGTQGPTLAETAPSDGSIELRSELTLAKPVAIKTTDGDMTIPAGTVVHTIHEKTAPGTVHINYEGYTVAVPLSAFAPLESR